MSAEHPQQSTEHATISSPMKWLGRLIRLAIILCVLTGSVLVAYYWMTHRPIAQRRPPQKEATLVEVIPVHLGTAQIQVRASGMVVPAKKIQLPVRVSGQISQIDPQFLPGGMFKEGQEILRLEQEDYKIALRLRQADYVKAESSRKLEMGQQSVAQREYELMGETVGKGDESLLLRKPQLESIQATCQAAKAALDRADLDLSRTIISAPFNAMIATQNVDLGSFVNPGTPLATIVGTDYYWIELSVPVDELRWLDIPGYNSDQASTVKVYNGEAWGKGVFRTATLKKLLTEVGSMDRTARLLVEVEDPLHLQAETERHPLILNDYVNALIEGAVLQAVGTIPRTALHDGNNVWIMTAENTLEMRQVEIVWSDEDYVYVSGGISENEPLIISDLGAPVPDMLLRLNGDENEVTAEENDAPAADGAKPGKGRGDGAGRGQGGQS